MSKNGLFSNFLKTSIPVRESPHQYHCTTKISAENTPKNTLKYPYMSGGSKPVPHSSDRKFWPLCGQFINPFYAPPRWGYPWGPGVPPPWRQKKALQRQILCETPDRLIYPKCTVLISNFPSKTGLLTPLSWPGAGSSTKLAQMTKIFYRHIALYSKFASFGTWEGVPPRGHPPGPGFPLK